VIAGRRRGKLAALSFDREEKTVKKTTLALAALGMLASVFVWQRHAASQIQVGPSYVPVGVAAGEGATTAWFHQPSSGRVVVCLAPARPGSAIQCSEGRLP
jgi:hypothetical protein